MKSSSIILAVILLSGCHSTPTVSDRPNKPKSLNNIEWLFNQLFGPASLPIDPKLSNLKPVDLPSLVFAVLPSSDSRSFNWFAMLDAPVRWQSDAVTWPKTGELITRDGLARVRVNGRVSAVLKSVKEELPWTVEMSTTGDVKWGPQEISILPGDKDGSSCFGTLYENCTFSPREAFNSKKFSAKYICQDTSTSQNIKQYFLLTSPGRSSVIATYKYGEGSGGMSSEISLTLANNSLLGAHDSLPGCATPATSAHTDGQPKQH